MQPCIRLHLFYEGKALTKSSGFTLIEVLIVVGIISILVALAIPAFADYRGKAREASAHTDAKNIIVLLVAARK